jgi:mannose-6-phosphate isomerase
MPGIALLDNPVQEYSWGSRTFIPRLLGKPFPAPMPQAELWMGAHPRGTSRVLWEGRWALLSDLIKEDPSGILGKNTAACFRNRLPFLFKVLAASKPLSIQAHPNRGQALEGFEREEKQGIPSGARHRNYRDPFHKPEMLCALTPFWALKGFRTVDEIRSILHRMGCPAVFLAFLHDEGENAIRKLFTALFTMNREEQKRLVSDLVSAAAADLSSDPVLEWMVRLQEAFPDDIGVLGPVFLNLILLQAGEALSIAAGELHSYLDGAGIEVMANSDNVLRGGLTEKHMDVPELFNILNVSTGQGRILHPHGQGSVERIYPEGAEEFVLSRIRLEHGGLYQSPLKRSVEIMICVEGRVEVSNMGTGETLLLPCGSSAMVPALVKGYRVKGVGTLYKAAVPLGKSAGSHGS